MRAKDLMIPLIERISPDNTLKEAAAILKNTMRSENKSGVKGMPVLDEYGKIVGFLSIDDMLKAVFPSYMNIMNLGEFTWDGMMEDMAKKAAKKKVSDMMTKEVVFVPEDAPLMECIDRMLKHHIKRLPVIDKSGKAVGLLHEFDIFFVITKSMFNENSTSK